MDLQQFITGKDVHQISTLVECILTDVAHIAQFNFLQLARHESTVSNTDYILRNNIVYQFLILDTKDPVVTNHNIILTGDHQNSIAECIMADVLQAFAQVNRCQACTSIKGAIADANNAIGQGHGSQAAGMEGTFAHLFQLIIQLNTLQFAAGIECIIADGFDIAAKGYIVQLYTAGECILTHGLCCIGNHDGFQCCTVGEGIAADGFHTATQRNILQRLTHREGIVLQGLHTIRDHDGRQIDTALERTLTDGGQTFGQSNAGQCGTCVKCIFLNSSNIFTNNEAGNFTAATQRCLTDGGDRLAAIVVFHHNITGGITKTN